MVIPLGGLRRARSLKLAIMRSFRLKGEGFNQLPAGAVAAACLGSTLAGLSTMTAFRLAKLSEELVIP